MEPISRRRVLRVSLGAATGALAMPYIANAQAKTAVCWLNQGFIPQEDAAIAMVPKNLIRLIIWFRVCGQRLKHEDQAGDQ